VGDKTDCEGKISGKVKEFADPALLVTIVGNIQEGFQCRGVIERIQRAKKRARPFDTSRAFSAAHCDLCEFREVISVR
jgi:hypothetical protein